MDCFTDIWQDGTEVFQNEIMVALKAYIDSRQIEDMSKESQSRWTAALIFIYNNVFKGTDKLKVKGNINNAYDINTLNNILNIYIGLCYEFDKIVYQSDYSKLTGVTEETLITWGKDAGELGSFGSELHKKLFRENESTTEKALNSGKRNPMCYMPSLNHRHGWNMPGTTNGSIAEQRKSLDQIAQEHRQELPGSVPDADF